MVTELQFIAIAAFLLWCLVSSVCGILVPAEEPALLIWREHGPSGWTGWRQAHFGLTAADLRILTQPEPVLDERACAGLFDTVLLQARSADSDAVQFAVARSDQDWLAVQYVSDALAVDRAAVADSGSARR